MSITHAVDGNISWDPNHPSDQVVKYQCEYQINAGSFIPCDSDIVGGTTYTQTILGVNSGDQVGFRIRACKVAVCSVFSVIATAIVPPGVAPGAPINFKIPLVN